MATQSWNQLKLFNLVTMATKKNCIKVVLTLIKKVVTKILAFRNVLKTVGVSNAIKSYNEHKFLNLVTMATI